jgi:hypothetical protein
VPWRLPVTRFGGWLIRTQPIYLSAAVLPLYGRWSIVGLPISIVACHFKWHSTIVYFRWQWNRLVTYRSRRRRWTKCARSSSSSVSRQLICLWMFSILYEGQYYLSWNKRQPLKRIAVNRRRTVWRVQTHVSGSEDGCISRPIVGSYTKPWLNDRMVQHFEHLWTSVIFWPVASKINAQLTKLLSPLQ